MNEEFNVNVGDLITNQLSLEGYFILWCLNSKNDVTMLRYTRNCRKIPTQIFLDLEQKELISINRENLPEDILTFQALKLTEKSKQLFEVPDFEVLFSELREAYPKQVSTTKRKLQTDINRCRTLYKKIIGNNIELHEKICKCAKLYYNQTVRAGSENFIQALPAWLHQRNYEQYLDEVNKYDKIDEVQSNVESI